MKTKKIIVSLLMIVIIGVASGCVHSNNKNWDDLSVQEQQDVIQTLDDAREEIKDDFSNNTAGFALGIVDKIEQVISNE